jgi:hypothetical protein
MGPLLLDFPLVLQFFLFLLIRGARVENQIFKSFLSSIMRCRELWHFDDGQWAWSHWENASRTEIRVYLFDGHGGRGAHT